MLAEYGITLGRGGGAYGRATPDTLAEAIVTDPNLMVALGAIFALLVFVVFVRN